MTFGSNRRCSSYTTTTARKCKKSFQFVIRDKKLCHIHAHILFDNSSIIIQRYFLGYKLRQKMKNIFLKLPDDLQRKIIWYIREAYYLEKHHYKPIRIILKKQYCKLSVDPYWRSNPNGGTSLNKAILYYIQITNIYKLYYKYNSITFPEYDKWLYDATERVKSSLALDIRYGVFNQKNPVWVSTMQKTLNDNMTDFIHRYHLNYSDKHCPVGNAYRPRSRFGIAIIPHKSQLVRFTN
jgi:hypothetical protein